MYSTQSNHFFSTSTTNASQPRKALSKNQNEIPIHNLIPKNVCKPNLEQVEKISGKKHSQTTSSLSSNKPKKPKLDPQSPSKEDDYSMLDDIESFASPADALKKK